MNKIDDRSKLVRLIQARINVQELIGEIEKHPLIWDSSVEEYSKKSDRKNVWYSIIQKFFPDYDERPSLERNEIMVIIQRKWKNIRTCYAREVQKKKTEKRNPGRVSRRQYLYFDSLHFLEHIYNKNLHRFNEVSYREEDDDDDAAANIFVKSEDIEYSDLELDEAEPVEPESIPNTTHGRKASTNEEEKKVSVEFVKTSQENDEDRMFLLSLVSEMNKVPSERKLKLRSDIIAAIYRAQQWPMAQYQDFDQNMKVFDHFLNHPAQKRCKTQPTATSTASASEVVNSPAPSEGSSRMSSSDFGMYD